MNEVCKETKTAKILHLALQQGDKRVLDLMVLIWGDTVYERLYEGIEKTTEEEKDEMIEELNGDKPALHIDTEAFIGWYFDKLTRDGVIDDLISPTGTGEIRLIDILQRVGFIPLDLVKNKENVQKDDIGNIYDLDGDIEEPGEKYRLELWG